jgi:hypothetical protein
MHPNKALQEQEKVAGTFSELHAPGRWRYPHLSSLDTKEEKRA